jgi:phosphoenolpyruvate synthase/pyruvate phosphate dikinase
VDNLASAVQRCWASLWTEHAIAYRARNNYPHDQVSLSVVVQEMIAPDVVSGRVTPDTYRVRRKNSRCSNNIAEPRRRAKACPRFSRKAIKSAWMESTDSRKNLVEFSCANGTQLTSCNPPLLVLPKAADCMINMALDLKT